MSEIVNRVRASLAEVQWLESEAITPMQREALARRKIGLMLAMTLIIGINAEYK